MACKFSQTDIICDHPSSSSRCRRYDVFLSFRGVDTRDNFAYYLYRAFREKGIHTFRDDDEIQGGKQVMTELMEAIKESKYSVLIISENYASSSWCLNELVQILECSKTLGHTVYAVFYRVDPSNVRKQTGKFGEGFSEAVLSKDQLVAQKWKDALVEIAGLKGWVYPNPGYEAEPQFIDALVEDIFGKLKDTYRNPPEGLVGMTSRMDKVTDLLDVKSDEARMVGIWGMGGIGKTTIAKAVYQSISEQFEGCSFIENVREVAKKKGLKALQKQLISNTLKIKDFKLENVLSGTDIIRERVCHKKVLIVLDDVDESIELESLIGKPHWFNKGSRIIITTRDQHMLTLLNIKDAYEVQKLAMDESEELFISKAFAENREIEEFQGLIDRAIKYAKGHPLALKVLGSSLLNLTVREWESALDRLKKSPGDKVQQVLRISYDGLHSEEKEIFLDISFFFKGKPKDSVVKYLVACGFNPDYGIRRLVKKSLLTISEKNTLEMHDLVQKMGQTIVHEESPKEPGERSRLWDLDDIKHVLTENTGTEKIVGIIYRDSLGAEDLKLDPNVFSKMTKLRYLMIHHSTNLKISDTCSSIDLPNMLRYLYWKDYPLKCLPSTFAPKYLVELNLTGSRIEQIRDGQLVLPKLKSLDLSYSKCLTKSPDFAGIPDLETLCLTFCTSLQNLHPSIKKLKRLQFLSLDLCTSLKTVPYGIGDLKQLEELDLDGTSITEVPQSIGNATNLRVLILSFCKKLKRIPSSIGQLKKLKTLCLKGCSSLNELPEEVGFLDSLEILNLDETSITEVPQSIGNATNLRNLNLSYCKKLKRIPSNIGQLKKHKMLLLTDCCSLNELPEEVGFMESLDILNVEYSGIRQLPSSVERLRNLKLLSLRGCKIFPSLPEFNSLKALHLDSCNLEYIPESIFRCFSLEKLTLGRNNFRNLPANIKGLTKLKFLSLNGCTKLLELPELPSNLRWLWAYGCESLKSICSPSVFKDAQNLFFSKCPKLIDNEEIKTLLESDYLFNQIKVNNNVDRVYACPGSKIPQWFTYQNDGALLKFQVPPRSSCPSNLLGYALSAVVSSERKHHSVSLQIRVGDKIWRSILGSPSCSYSGDVSIWYIPIAWSNVARRDLEVRFAMIYHDPYKFTPTEKEIYWEPAPEVKSCGARLIYEDDLLSFGKNDKARDDVRSIGENDNARDDLGSNLGEKDKAKYDSSLGEKDKTKNDLRSLGEKDKAKYELHSLDKKDKTQV